jgi:hypothetical protein
MTTKQISIAELPTPQRPRLREPIRVTRFAAAS